jgi:hypothetical protein
MTIYPHRFERPLRTTPIRRKVTYTVPPPTKPAPVILCEDYGQLYALIFYLTHPDQIEGYEEVQPDECDGSDTSMESQLTDAGFGSGGII